MFPQDPNPDELSQLEQSDGYSQQIEQELQECNRKVKSLEEIKFACETHESRGIYIKYLRCRIDFLTGLDDK